MAERLSAASIKELLDYDPATGELVWKSRMCHSFRASKVSDECAAARWNGKFAGRRAFTITDAYGYKAGSIFNRRYLAHRVIWALTHGEWPDEIDHINGDRADNRLANLRSANRQENMRNMRLGTRNKSGSLGVSWDASRNKWRATITDGGKHITIGRFDDKMAAVDARKRSEAECGYHANHGIEVATAHGDIARVARYTYLGGPDSVAAKAA